MSRGELRVRRGENLFIVGWKRQLGRHPLISAASAVKVRLCTQQKRITMPVSLHVSNRKGFTGHGPAIGRGRGERAYLPVLAIVEVSASGAWHDHHISVTREASTNRAYGGGNKHLVMELTWYRNGVDTVS